MVELDPKFIDKHFREEIEQKLLNLVKEKSGALSHYLSQKSNLSKKVIAQGQLGKVKLNENDQVDNLEKLSDISEIDEKLALEKARQDVLSQVTVHMVNNNQKPKSKNKI